VRTVGACRQPADGRFVTRAHVTAARPVGRPRDTSSEDTEQAIRAAALTLFADMGYGNTTNRAVAERAGVSTGTVYYHFESKRDMFLAVLHDTRAAIRERLLGPTGNAESLAARITRMIDAALELHAEHPVLARFEAAAAVDLLRHPELVDGVSAKLEDGRAVLVALVAGARRRGEVSDELSDEAVADAISALLIGLSQLALRIDRPQLDHAFRASCELLAGRMLTRRETL
jgi:AcrR family transcriptional regulator